MGDKYWYKTKYKKEMVLSHHCKPGPFDVVLVLDNLKGGYNVGKIIRTANVLGCREVHLINVPMFDPNPAKGALKYTPTRSFQTFKESYEHLLAQGYALFAMDPKAASVLGRAAMPDKTAFIVGHEEYGFSFEPEEFKAVRWLKIQQFGIVQSLNVSVAASMGVYEYLRQRDFVAPHARVVDVGGLAGGLVVDAPAISGVPSPREPASP